MSLYNVIGEERPRMDVPKGKKDRDYHRRMGRADRSSINNGILERLYAKSILAQKAYNDEIWTQEDIDTFLLDESQNTRNRVMFGFNMVKPFVEQMRGATIQSEFSASVQAVSKGSSTRRQNALAQQQIMHSLADMSPELRRIISGKYNLGDTMDQTIDQFQWQDANLKAMNHLLEKMAAINQMNRFRGEDGFRFAITGLLAEILRPNGSHLYWEKIHAHDFFYDTTAKMPDLSDAAFMGCMPEMRMSAIAEAWDVSKEQLSDIEASIKAHGMLGGIYENGRNFSLGNQTKVRALSDFWQDVSFAEFGYINGDGGVPTLVPVGYSESGEEPKYTKNDCIAPPKSEENDELFKGNRTRKSFVECTRFVDMVLWEDMAGTSCNPERHTKLYQQGELPDLVLDYGLYDLQEYNPYDTNRSRSPIKATVYALANGEIVSPVQAILDPNRFVNRVLSGLEGQMNMAGGKTLMVDLDLFDANMTLDQIDSRRKQGKTIGMNAGGRGVSTAMGTHDDSPGTGAYAMLQIVQSVQDLVRSVTGVHSTMMGEGQKDMGKGVAELLVQRGATMQASFHDSYDDLQLQKYRSMATAGKEWYLDRIDVLLDMVSEDDLRYLYQTRDFEMERFNVTVVRDNPERTRRALANQWLDQLLPLGVIDRQLYFELYNNSNIEDLSPALRRYSAELNQAENAARKEEAKQQMMAGLTAQAQQLDAEEKEMTDKQMDAATMMAKEGAKEQANVTREQQKHENDKERMMTEARAGLG